MEFSEYQRQAKKTSIYPSGGIQGLAYTCLGLNGEAGEVAERIKKIIRCDYGLKEIEGLNEAILDVREDLIKELGDVLWYLSAMCHEIGTNLDEVALVNLAKLKSRMDRGKIKGSGDNR